MKKQSKIELLIEKFTKQFQIKHNKDDIKIEGVLLFGSYVNPNQISKNSDLDLYIVIKNNGKRYRGIIYIDNVEVDYFINPIIQLQDDFEQALKDPKKTVIHMLAEGKILKDTRNQLLKLQKKAIEALKKERSQILSNFAVVFTKYFIDDFLKDIQDNYDEKDFFAWEYNVNLLLNYLIESFCKSKGILMVKPKHQKEKIQKVNPAFVKLFEEISSAVNREKKMKLIKKLSEYTLNSLGGKLPKEWELESPVNL